MSSLFSFAFLLVLCVKFSVLLVYDVVLARIFVCVFLFYLIQCAPQAEIIGFVVASIFVFHHVRIALMTFFFCGFCFVCTIVCASVAVRVLCYF